MDNLVKLNDSINALAETLFQEPYKGELGPLCDAAVEKIHELNNWKRQSLIILEELDLQAIGKEMNLPIGKSVPKQILPKLKEHKETMKRVLTVLKDIQDEYRALDLPYGSKPYADATSLINDLEYPK